MISSPVSTSSISGSLYDDKILVMVKAKGTAAVPPPATSKPPPPPHQKQPLSKLSARSTTNAHSNGATLSITTLPAKELRKQDVNSVEAQERLKRARKKIRKAEAKAKEAQKVASRKSIRKTEFEAMGAANVTQQASGKRSTNTVDLGSTATCSQLSMVAKPQVSKDGITAVETAAPSSMRSKSSPAIQASMPKVTIAPQLATKTPAFVGIPISEPIQTTDSDSDSDSDTESTNSQLAAQSVLSTSASDSDDAELYDSGATSMIGDSLDLIPSRTPDHNLRSFLTGRSERVRSSATIPFTTQDAFDLGTVTFPMKSLFGEVLEGSVHGFEIRPGMFQRSHSRN